jgi:tetratricopeptide (TPR) repeat protein
VGDRLRPTWDFDDLDGSQQRFRALLEEEQTDDGRAEILTQLARVEGLRDRFDEGDALLDEAEALAGSTPVVRVRIDLERGRLRRSGGDPEAALPLFEAAFETALAIPHEFLAVDAAHMVAIAAPELETRLAWSNRGIDLARASSDPEVTYWLGSLFNNVGWDYFDAGDYESALDWFELALVERQKRPDEPKRIELAREAVDEARSKLQSSPAT